MNSGQFSKTIILSNGAYPKHPVPLKILKEAESLICCDGAVDELIANGILPTVIIGDMDSISPINKEKYKNITIQLNDQETNDQTKAVEYCLRQGYSDITILGATGKREDHTLGNISLLCNYRNKIKVCAVSDYGVFTPIIESTSFSSFCSQQVSIFSLTPEIKINSENLKYPLDNLQLKFWWMGTLNESLSDKFSIFFDKGELIIFQVFNI
jgi:thiamine pyrophosphokinase